MRIVMPISAGLDQSLIPHIIGIGVSSIMEPNFVHPIIRMELHVFRESPRPERASRVGESFK